MHSGQSSPLKVYMLTLKSLMLSMLGNIIADILKNFRCFSLKSKV